MAVALLLVTCGAMLAAALAAGNMALSTAASSSASPTTDAALSDSAPPASALAGAGLLVSCGLAVVVVEGFHALDDIPAGALPHWAPGAALVAGFFAMLALDAAADAVAPHAHASPDAASLLPPPALAGGPVRDGAVSALDALLAHAAADGLAVGAATAAGGAVAAATIAVAMAAHKAPAAYGLGATLAAHRWSPARARRGIAMFAATSPAAAILTHALVAAAGSAAVGVVPLALLASGGSLVYAGCVHVLPSALARARARGGLRVPAHAAALAGGAVAPVVLAGLFPHGH